MTNFTITGSPERYHRTHKPNCRVCNNPVHKGDTVVKANFGGKRNFFIHESCSNGETPKSPETKPEPKPEPKKETKPLATTSKNSKESSLIKMLNSVIESGLDENRVIELIEERLSSVKPTVTEIKIDGKPTVKLEGEILHKEFKKILTLLKMKKNVMMVGPTGSGKTHLAEQIAKALDRPFGFISCSKGMSETQILGKQLIRDGLKMEYVRSKFVECYENGGVFLLDEIDSCDPNTLIAINAALSNGSMSVPNRPEKPVAKKHDDFVCLAAANTFGTGADRQYTGRRKLDASTLERFKIGTVYIDYDERVEKKVCPDDELRTRLTKIRKAVSDLGLERVVSTRFMGDAYDMKSAGWTDKEIDSALFSGWKPAEVSAVKNAVK